MEASLPLGYKTWLILGKSKKTANLSEAKTPQGVMTVKTSARMCERPVKVRSKSGPDSYEIAIS